MLQPDQSKTQALSPTPGEIEKAAEQLKDLLCICVLNLKLKRAGLCPKYICEMSDEDYQQYGSILDDLLFKR